MLPPESEREQWGQLTDDKLNAIARKRDQLFGKIQDKYDVTKDEAERQVKYCEARNERLLDERPTV